MQEKDNDVNEEGTIHAFFDNVSLKKAMDTANKTRFKHKFWRFSFVHVREYLTGMIRMYYPFWYFNCTLSSEKKTSSGQGGLLIDAKYRELGVMFGLPAIGQRDAGDALIIDPIITREQAEERGEKAVQHAIETQQKKIRRFGMAGMGSMAPDTYEMGEPDLVHWPFWVFRFRNKAGYEKYRVVDVAMNIKSFNDTFSKIISGPLYPFVSKKFKEIEERGSIWVDG